MQWEPLRPGHILRDLGVTVFRYDFIIRHAAHTARLKRDCFKGFCFLNILKIFLIRLTRQTGIFLFQIDYNKPYKAYSDADEFIPCKRFVIKQKSDENQSNREDGALHD